MHSRLPTVHSADKSERQESEKEVQLGRYSLYAAAAAAAVEYLQPRYLI
jgi:hypothetical protein